MFGMMIMDERIVSKFGAGSTTTVDGLLTDSAYSQSLDLIIAINGSYSPDRGLNWFVAPNPSPTLFQSVIWSPEDEIFVRVGKSATDSIIETSVDGFVWTTRQTSTMTDSNKDYFIGVSYSPVIGRYVAIEYRGDVWFSDNAITWSSGTATESIGGDRRRHVFWDTVHSRFVSCGSGIEFSSDGITWTTQFTFESVTGSQFYDAEYMIWSPTISKYVVFSLAYGNYVTEDTQIFTSDNGTTLTPVLDGVFGPAGNGQVSNAYVFPVTGTVVILTTGDTTFSSTDFIEYDSYSTNDTKGGILIGNECVIKYDNVPGDGVYQITRLSFDI